MKKACMNLHEFAQLLNMICMSPSSAETEETAEICMSPSSAETIVAHVPE